MQLWERAKAQFRHWKILQVASDQHQVIRQSDGCDGRIRQRKGTILLPPYVQQVAGLFGNFPRDGVKLQTSQKPLGLSLLAWPQSGVNLSNVNRTASHIGPVLDQSIDEFPPTALAVEGIYDNSRIEQTDRKSTRLNSSHLG